MFHFFFVVLLLILSCNAFNLPFKTFLRPNLISGFGLTKDNLVYDIVKSIIENKEVETGITIHYISEEYDSGKIIFQKKIKVDKHDTPEKLEEKIHKLEYEYFPKVIESLLI